MHWWHVVDAAAGGDRHAGVREPTSRHEGAAQGHRVRRLQPRTSTHQVSHVEIK